jgi:hypothetical protein
MVYTGFRPLKKNDQKDMTLKIMAEGSLEIKLPTIWRDEKAVSREKSQKTISMTFSH